ncbi:fluoroacetate dehalogenase [Actinomycetospora sp. NBRC 106375]|uniref:alpha/beta fold hydrolase n=1 Tax=Actinomycetospora sp. NBRC 106375 TaxID=3032207 RepID=UPI0024A1EC11|nr:alpha/beta fold hydrolase [Actinomycetospora sp. NBRC 106375]GLZ48583.1 fluoroacetate dehalogenase [Actinomycetospora sp. NBRC 106375]
MSLFPGFDVVDVTVGGTTIHGRVGGTGPPLLLLHGIPETHLMWRDVAPALAADHTVVVTDLRGYGGSGVGTGDDHSMRSLAAEQLAVMRALGHERFAVAGHDRGARCAYRLALDHPDHVTALAVLDVVPTAEAFARADREFALGYWVWSMLAAPEPVAERLVLGAPDVLVDHMLDSWSDDPAAFPPWLRERYAATFRDPGRVHAICAQYRAAATADVEHDEADRGAGNLRCPVHVLWSATGAVEAWYDPLAVWRQWADDVRGGPVDAGHFLPEEAPDVVLAALRELG